MSFVYSQRTGRFSLRCGGLDAGLIATGYAGHAAGLNAPEMEHARNLGPIPKGQYSVRLLHHKRFASPAFYLVPSASTAKVLAAYGRSGFWIHGDNQRGDRSASHGCIILPRAARQRILALTGQGYRTLVVED